MKCKYFPILFKNGFFITENIETKTPEDAFDILTSNQIYKYTSVFEKEGLYFFKNHQVTCGLCGSTYPAYCHIIGDYKPSLKVLPDEAEAFVTQATSFFNCEQENKLDLYTPISQKAVFTCPDCGESMKHAAKEDFVFAFLQTEGEIIKLVCAYNNNFIDDFLTNTPLTTRRRVGIFDDSKLRIIDSPDITYEIIDFDLNTGCVNGSFYCNGAITNISEGMLVESSSHLTKYINEVAIVKIQLRNAFREFWNVEEFPFLPEEISLERLILLTKFIGYKRCFYENYKFAKFSLDDAFSDIFKKLHKASNNKNLFAELNLPQNTKEYILSNPQFFFFAKEINRLSQILTEKDILVFLKSRKALETLNVFYSNPGCFHFCKDFSETVGKDALLSELTCNFIENMDFILRYASKSKILKEKQKRIWLENKDAFDEETGNGIPVKESETDKCLNYFSYTSQTINFTPTFVKGVVFKPVSNAFELIRLENEAYFNMKNYKNHAIIGLEKYGRYIGFLKVKLGRTNIVKSIFLRSGLNNDSNISDAIEFFCREKGFKIFIEKEEL